MDSGYFETPDFAAEENHHGDENHGSLADAHCEGHPEEIGDSKSED